MKFDVVPICSAYRGIGRSLTPQSFCSKFTKRKTDELLELYYKYITESLKPECQESFEYMLCLCSKLKEYDIPCEVIIYDSQPIESAYGRSLSFLGIDIVYKMSESLLENGAEGLPQSMLNEHLLCAKVSDVPNVVKLCDHGDVSWLPCWVYCVQ